MHCCAHPEPQTLTKRAASRVWLCEHAPHDWLTPGVPNQELDLSGCQCLTDAALCGVAMACPSLARVNISSCYELTDVAFGALGGCGRLRAVNACGCDRLTDAGLAALAAGTRCGLSSRMCSYLDVVLPQPNWALVPMKCSKQPSPSSRFGYTMWVMGAELHFACRLFKDCLRMCQQCREAHCQDSGLLSCRGLRELNLGWCEAVTEAGVTALAASCPKLEVLDLCGCIQVPFIPYFLN